MEFIKKNKLDTVIFLVVLMVSMLIFGGSLLDYKGKKAFLAVVVLSALAAVLIDIISKRLSKNVWQQIVILCILPMAFILSSTLFNRDNIDFSGKILYEMYGIFFCTFYIIVCSFIEWVAKIKLSNAKQFVIQHKMMLIFLLFIILIRIPYIDMLPRWDSGEYYLRFNWGIEDFRYSSFQEFLETFTLCGHPTLAFCLVYMIGGMIFPKHVIAVSLVSLLLTAVAMWCIYRIFLRMLAGITPLKAAIFTFVLSMAPLFYSTSSYFNPDYAMTLFFIFVIYSYVYQKLILAGLSSLMCFQTKETGLVLVGGLVIGIFVQHFLENKGIEFVKALFTDLRLYFTLAATILQFMYNNYIGGISNWSQNGMEEPGLKWDNNGENCLGINLEFIGVKLKQQFILNFNWIITLVVFVCIILLLVNRKKIARQIKKHEICGVVGAFTALLLFSCLYITSAVARYNVIGDILLYIILFYVLSLTEHYLLHKKNKFRVYADLLFCSIFVVLITGECFLTIDPMTRLSFRKLDAVNTNIYYMGKNLNVNNMYYGDYLIYNTQYSYIDKAYDELLEAVDYEPGEMDIILPDSNDSFIGGNIPMYYLNWNKKLKKRVFYQDDDTKPMEDYILIKEIQNKDIKVSELKERAVLVFNPYWLHVNIQDKIKEISKYYDLSEEKTAGTFQGSIIYYELTLKK